MEIPYIDISQLGHISVEVKIFRVISPSYFWAQLCCSKDEFFLLMEGIQRQMREHGNELTFWPEEVREGDICCVDIDEGVWQRGVVLKDLGGGSILVELKDWGTIMFRKKYHVYRLEEKFRELPWQGIPCGLAYTAPSTLAPYWPKKANTLMKLCCEGRKVTMRIQGCGGVQNREAYVDLKVKMENDGDVTHMRSLLKSFGYGRDVVQLKPNTQPYFVEASP